ncbi:MAG: tRNA (N6-isopentenyl adenosine(37)-C2)-methylthiotransferase MiaB [Desulfovermiculus sp.]|nr:tRNA (N6-isopentenyl adenosine(37)-C2)-methylthiotransferase MiaB [Desulfovermiculus sp.]
MKGEKRTQTFHIITFGCQMNVCDSQWMEQSLSLRGWTPAAEEEAEVIVVNTCSVREKPEQKVYSLLGRLSRLKKNNPGLFVGVGGCVAQQIGEHLWNRFPFVRLVFGSDGVAQVPEAVERLREDPGLRLSFLDFSSHYPERERVWDKSSSPVQAYVTIMQGCDNFCAYCIVPYTRGRQKSRPAQEVLAECADLVHSGAREITLLGQNVNSYGQDRAGDGVGFAQLLSRVCSLPGLERVRFTTSHPKDLDPQVIEAFSRFDNLCPALHLPLQSGSDRILRKMGRKYSQRQYLDLVQALRQARPDIVLSTDLIVGFPGEEDQDFEQTIDLVERVGFDSSFSFKYSQRPGVRACLLPGQVAEEVKARRLQRLQSLQDELTLQSLGSLIGRSLPVLVEKLGRRNSQASHQWQAREPGGRLVHFSWPLGWDLTGRFVQVRITTAMKHSVSGEAVKGPW